MGKHELLSDPERERLIGIPTERNELARLYTLEGSDLELILQRRGDRNCLGFALQLATLRHPGAMLTQLLARTGRPPVPLVRYLAHQLHVPVTALADYATREQTMTDHGRYLAEQLGLRVPTREDIPFMIEAAAIAAWSTDQGFVIAGGVIDALRGAQILLPSIATIERAAIAGRARARKRTTHALLRGVGPDQLDHIDNLFVADPSTGETPLAWLKAIPAAAKPNHVREVLNRLRVARRIGIPADAAASVHPDRFRQLLREGRASPAYLIERYATPRRRATAVALLIDLEERLTDAAIEMADKLIAGIFTRARNTQARRYAATSRDVSRLMRLFRGTIDALAEAIEGDTDPIDAVNEMVGWANLLKVRHEVAALADTAGEDPLVVAADRYGTLRKFAPALIEALDFKAGRGSTRTIVAVRLLRELNGSGRRDVPPDAPMPFKKEWRKLVTEPDGKINRRLYETATLAHLRNKLRSGDVWVERSSAYRRFDSYLLPKRGGADRRGSGLARQCRRMAD